MKKVIAAALSILLIVGIMPVALAEDIAPVRVSTLAELQKAIADAESGDTICVTQTIIVSGNIQVGEEGKSICFASCAMSLLCLAAFGMSVYSLQKASLSIAACIRSGFQRTRSRKN